MDNRAVHAIIGTAGHIDHGKTALIKALTGQDTDRLQEEKERGISIELGFAFMALADGRRAGVVDVPGHERFIRNMLAGAHGIDLVLFTVAADDGVMPQTEEHFDILHLLGTRRGIFVITKADLVNDRRIAEVGEEIAILAEGTALERAPVTAVSVVSGVGLDGLRAEIARQLETFERSGGESFFRLPLDRVFTIKGHGTVVTGTARGAEVRAGQNLVVVPGGQLVRVRSIQVHNAAVESALAGQRVALNLGGAERLDLRRGVTLCDERIGRASARIDVRLEIRPAAKRPLKNHQRVRFFLGTAEVRARVAVLDESAQIAPKHSGLAQLILDEPVAALKDDRFVIRDETNMRTLGGGVVINPFGRVTRRPLGAYVQYLERVEGPSSRDAAEAMLNLQESFALPFREIAPLLNRPDNEVASVLRDGRFVSFGAGEDESYTTAARWEEMKRRIIARVTGYHREHPLETGAELEELRSQLRQTIAPREFRLMIERISDEAGLARDGSRIRLKSHNVRLTSAENELRVRIEEILTKAGFQPPELKQLAERAGVAPAEAGRLRSLLAAMEREQRITRVATELYFSSEAVVEARRQLVERLRRDGSITAAGYRDVLGASRKFAIALLAYFDHSGVTIRTGDERKLRMTA
jgi:selenocysteine-specific elongation factor